MNRTVGTLVFIMMLFAASLPVFLLAQEITTTAPEEVLEQEAFQIQYDILSMAPIQEMPNLVDAKEYELLREPEISRFYPSPFWGRKEYTLRVICIFKAKKKGKLKLPRIEITTDGKRLSSRKGTILVKELPEMGNVDCFVKTTMTKGRVNVGDTLTITYKLYTTKEIASVIQVNVPRLRDFYYQDLSPRRVTFSEETVNGVDYKVYVVGKHLLQSKTLGNKQIPAGKVEIEYTYPTGRVRNDRWGRSYEEQLRETKSCIIEPVTISVHDMISI